MYYYVLRNYFLKQGVMLGIILFILYGMFFYEEKQIELGTAKISECISEHETFEKKYFKAVVSFPAGKKRKVHVRGCVVGKSVKVFGKLNFYGLSRFYYAKEPLQKS